MIPKHRHPRPVSPSGASVAQQNLGWSSLLGMGAVNAAVIAVGLGLGWLVDNLLGTMPAFILSAWRSGSSGAATYVVVQFRTYLKT